MTVDNDDQLVEELSHLSSEQQANKFVNYYATTRNKFTPVTEDDIPDFDFNLARQNTDNILTTPERIKDIISSMNKSAANINIYVTS